MKKNYAYTVKNPNHYTSSQLWRLFALSLLCLLVYPVEGLKAKSRPDSNTAEDILTVHIENELGPSYISCDNENVNLVATTYLNGVQQNPSGISFRWVGPDGFEATGSRIEVTVAGEYELTAQTASGLSATAKYLVRGIDGAAGPDKVLRTSETSVKLSADSRTWGWFTPSWTASDGGNIVSGADTFTPSVDAPGTYTLTLTNKLSGCTMEDTMVVTEAEDVLIAYAGYGGVPEINCEGTPITIISYVRLNGKEVTEGITYSWTGPNGFTSEEKFATVREPGIYLLEVKHIVTGLTSTASIEVEQLRFPKGSAGPDKILTCDNPTVVLEGSIIDDFGHPIWLASDGGNFVSGYRTLNPVVDAPGTYTLILQHEKGCQVEYTVKVTRAEGPKVSATGGRLDCSNGSLQLIGSSDTEGVTYTWTGPNGYTSSEQKPVVMVAGDYTLTVTDPQSGCSASTMVVVTPSSTELTAKEYVIDFNSEKKGLISSIETDAGPVNIVGRKRNQDGTYATENHGSIFDTQAPTGDDADLYTTDWGNALIINTDLSDVPNDNQWGGELILDFSAIGPVTLESIGLLDMDHYEDMSWVYLYDKAGNELHKVHLLTLGNNSQQTVDLGDTRGVAKLKVVLDGKDGSGNFAGSSAIDDIRFRVEKEVESACENVQQQEVIQALAYPTTFSDFATIQFILQDAGDYEVDLYDIHGTLVKRLNKGTAIANEQVTLKVTADGLKEGMYLASIITPAGRKTLKLVLKR